MESRFRKGPDPAVRVTEREARSFRPIQGGDAAKAAEESNQESATYHGAFGVTLRSVRGARFELEKEPSGQGEALPLPSEASKQALPITPNEQQTEEHAGITKKLFRRLFRS